MNERATILIPTFNRPVMVQRLARYYTKAAPWLDLLVLDSSHAELVEPNAKALAGLGSHVRHVPFGREQPPLAKIVRGLELTQTPWVAFCADDDLVFPGPLSECFAFLQAHPDYASAHGLY